MLVALVDRHPSSRSHDPVSVVIDPAVRVPSATRHPVGRTLVVKVCVALPAVLVAVTVTVVDPAPRGVTVTVEPDVDTDTTAVSALVAP